MKHKKTQKGKLESKGHQSTKKKRKKIGRNGLIARKKYTIGVKTPIARGPSNLCPKSKEEKREKTYKSKAPTEVEAKMTGARIHSGEKRDKNPKPLTQLDPIGQTTK